MEANDANVIWFTYQRVILPHRFTDNKKGVVVVSKQSPVDIKIL